MGLRTLFFCHSFLFFLTHFLLGTFYSNLVYNLTVKRGIDNQTLFNDCMVTDYKKYILSNSIMENIDLVKQYINEKNIHKD